MIASVSRLASAFVLAVSLAGCNEAKKAPEARQDAAVLVVSAHFQNLLQDRSLPGTVRPRVESDLGFRVPGKILKRLVDTGAVVADGEPLATLDDTDANLQLDQARAELDAAGSALASAANSQKRIDALRKDGWSTPADFDRQRAATDEAQGRVLKARRALALAENAVAYSTLKADSAGVVTAILAEPGQVVAAGQAAIRVAHTDEKEVLVAVPETMLERARRNEARVSLWSDAGKVFPARLRELSPAADAATRTYAARFSLPTAGADVQLGMTATVTLAEVAPRVMRLPLSALFDQGQGPQVYVVDPATDTLKLTRIEVASYEADAVVVRSGLEDGDRVVALGVQKLEAGQKVRATETL